MELNNYKFKKRFGQNFLKEEKIIDKILDNSDIEDNSLVLEIGCGSGQLTKKLVNKFSYILGYEIDPDLKVYLDEIKSDYLNIIFDDFLKRDILEDIKNYKYNKLYVISNLPYYITTPIIEKIINEKLNAYRVIIMVQKEVGDRINAKPNSKEYNSLSIFINYNFDIKRILNVGRGCFIPQPNVDSIVLKLSEKLNKYEPLDEQLFYRIVRESFQFKRKTLKNNLKEYDFEVVSKVLNENNFPDNVRGEQLPIEMFIKISDAIYLNKIQ